MATSMSQEAICRLVKYNTLTLEMPARRKPDYRGCVVMDDMLIAIDGFERSLHVYNLHVGKRITSHRLEDWPLDVCLINKTEVAVRLGWRGKVVILSVTSRDGVKLVNTLQTGLYLCDSLVKWRSDKLVISGKKKDDMLCWGILSLTDGRLDSTHDICKGYGTRMDVREDTVYISCRTRHSIANGVHAFNLLTNKQKFVYQHRELISPESIMADRDYVYVCDRHYNKIHQLTDSGQLVTIHPVSSRPWSMFYDDQQGLIYTTSEDSIVITVYKMESSRQEDSVIPAEVLKMDTGSLHIYKNALCDGYEKVYNIRVMVVGQYGVGKTTLTQRLLGKNVNISERHSTEGIDVHIECSKVSLSTGEWTTQEKNADKYSRLQRLVRLLNEHSNKQQSKREQDRQSELDVQDISVEYDNSHTQHNLLVSKERYDGEPMEQDKPVSVEPSTNQIVKEPSSQPVESPIVRLDPESSSGIHSKGNEKDTVMEILKQVNETSGKLEKDTMQYAALALWDFAGQHSFYTTHQTFLTSRAIYLLVINLSQQVTAFIQENECFLDAKGKQLCNIPEMMEIWLNMIHSCAPSSHPGNPPVILIGTHADKIPEKNRQKVIDEYFMKLRQMLKSKPLVLHLVDDIAIDNTLESDPSLEKLKRRIFELASQQPYWGEEKPARWLPLEQAIMTMRDSDVKVAPLSLIEEINRSSSVKIEDRGELELFLNFQHDIGTILYFNADGLRENIVLNPQWMIDVFRSLITAKMFIKQHPTITEEWFEFEETGKLTHKLIDAIWTKEKPDFHDNKEYLLLVMTKLNIIARPMSYTMDGKSVKEEDYYLAPCILRQETPREILCPESDHWKESTSAICFVCKGKFLPPPIFHRLVGACLTHWPIAKQDENNLIFCGCCLFDIDNYHRLSLHSLGHVIFARVTIMGVKDVSKSSKLCSEARKFILENLLRIIGNLGQSLEFELHMQCPLCDADSLDGMIAVSLLQKEHVVCNAHVKRHTLESRQLLKFWFEDLEQTAIEGKMSETGLKVDETSEVIEKVLSTSRITENLHQTVLNRCLPNLMKDLNVELVMKYIQQHELFDDVTIRDILQQTTTKAITHIINEIKQRDQYTYECFKECLILAKRADLKIMLEEEEENLAAEMKDKHQGSDNLTEDRIRHLLSSETDLKVYISDNPPEACIKILLSQASKQNRKESMKIILHCIVQRFTARFSEKQVRIWPGEEVIGSVNVQTVLVCFYSGSVDISFKSFYDLKVIYRDYYTTDKESSLAREHERNINDLTSEHCDLINEAITINGKSLFAKHSNLEAVSSSGILSSKSRGLVQEPCVILYCRVKGIIPFGEMPFPKRLKVNEEATIAVDVREGYFSYYADSRNKDQKNVLHHENMQLMESLKMGLSIGSAGSLQSGTIGPFVQINSDRIGFLTCAHVVYCQSELIYLANIAQTDPIAKEIVQPPDNHYYASHYQSNHRLCGKVLHAMFCGDWSPSSTQAFGIDAAVIEITSRFPNAGAFVPIHQSQLDDAGFSLDQPPKFDTGHMILHPINWRLQRAVIKIGSETGLTRGLLRLTNGMVKYSKLTGTQASIDHDRPEPIEIIMHGLMEISSVSCNSNPFCSHGDSGAGVFIVADDDNTNKLICLGLLNGTITDGISTAMPIDMILTALHRGDGLQLKLKDF